MSKLDELIKELCPNGVEYKPIGEICDILRGRRLTTRDLIEDGEYPVFHGGIEPIGYYNQKNRDGYSTMVINVGASAGTIGFCDKDFWSSDGCFCFSHTETLNQKFLFYVLQSNEHYLKSKVRKAGIPTLDNKEIERFQIPVPPLSIQNEIIHILDTFTSLTAELTAELTARRKQYEYYRDSLLTFGDDVEWKTLGELFEFKNGLNKEKDAFGKGKTIVNFTDVYNKRWLTKERLHGLVDVNGEEQQRYSAKKGDVFFTRTSETKEDVGMASVLLEDIEGCVFSGFVLRARPLTDLFIPKFYSYYFSTPQVRKIIVKYASFTTRALTSGPRLAKIKIPLISKEQQERIVSILDRFESLCNDITSGLPAEIETRQKQYEYYRDKLLTFKRKEA